MESMAGPQNLQTKNMLVTVHGESMIADRGYSHDRCILPTVVTSHARLLHGHIRAGHKAYKERFKQVSILRQVFRHYIQLHGRVLHVSSKVIALSICHEEPLFQI